MITPDKLRSLRPELVRAAEEVFREPQSANEKKKKLKSQLNHLVAVCNEATCHDEIALYLRYQASRENPPIDYSLVKDMIEKIESVFKTAEFDDEFKVAAWRLYAVYLARTFTYRSKAGSPDTRSPTQPEGKRPTSVYGQRQAKKSKGPR